MLCEPTSATAPRLLVIDDDPAVRRVVANVARGAGFDVTDCDGDADLDACLEQHADMIILDLVMPVRDGIEVIERLATAHGLKVAAVFTKPFSNAELRSCCTTSRRSTSTLSSGSAWKRLCVGTIQSLDCWHRTRSCLWQRATPA